MIPQVKKKLLGIPKNILKAETDILHKQVVWFWPYLRSCRIKKALQSHGEKLFVDKSFKMIT